MDMKKDIYSLTDDILHHRRQLQRWFETDLGQGILQLEKQKVSRVLPDLFGYHILQLGYLENHQLLDSSRISHKLISGLVLDDNTNANVDLVCSNYAIPIVSDSMDVVVLPHLLEFESNPHQLLRETQRILIGEGSVVILGFNPASLWGMIRLFLAWTDKSPWCGHYIGLTRLKDWLKLLGFEIVTVERFFYRPPVKNKKVMQRLEIIEQLGNYCWPFFAGIYLLIAKKRVIPVTPLKLEWQKRRSMIASGAAEPSTRILGN